MKEPPGHSDVDKFANNDEVVGLDELSARLGSTWAWPGPRTVENNQSTRLVDSRAPVPD